MRALLRSGERVTCRLAFAEIVSALAGRLRDGEVSTRRYETLLRRLRADVARFHVVEITPALFEAAEPLFGRHALRAAGGLHLAAALRANGERASAELVCYDERLAKAARAEGLRVRGLPAGR